jgi:hypothetical protein
MLMSHSTNVVPLRALAALEERVNIARVRLQRTTEADPAFERRVKTLVELVRKRDHALSGDAPFLPPAA